MKQLHLAVALLLLAGSTLAQTPARLIPYKIVEGDTLMLHVFEPATGSKSPHPAIVFFFGGGWVGGSPEQFYPQAEYFASRGMVAISAEYRVKNRHGVSPFECVADGKSAVRWIRGHAGELGIDPDRIVASGGSAGGHVAAATGILSGHEESGENTSVSSKPAALVLFNPVIDTSEKGYGADKLGERWLELSPVHHVAPDQPPTIVFHGTADTTVPYENAQRFCMAMTYTGNVCRLISFEDQGHGFFNKGRHNDIPYAATLRAADEFLIELGILEGSPNIE